MKKLFLAALLVAIGVSVAGCDLYGTVKNVKIQYTTANYTTGKMVTKTVTNVATDTNNALLNLDTSGSYYTISEPTGYYVSSDSGGIWMTIEEGFVVDPVQGATASSLATADKSFSTNAVCVGVVRVSGTGTYNPATETFVGDGTFIYFPIGAMNASGTGKWTLSSGNYTGTAKATITLGYEAALVTVTGGSVTGPPVPVSATITVSGVALTLI